MAEGRNRTDLIWVRIICVSSVQVEDGRKVHVVNLGEARHSPDRAGFSKVAIFNMHCAGNGRKKLSGISSIEELKN